MTNNVFDRIQSLDDWCAKLYERLEEARFEVPDEDFQVFLEGPMGEVICAAIDVEAAWLKCVES